MFSLFQGLMAVLLILTSAFMILLILVQRGRGGGLTGALGGAGGQSAFGSKAGDVFTRITIGTAVVWIVLAMMTISIFNPPPRPVVLENPAGSLRGMESETNGPGANKSDALEPGVSELKSGLELESTPLPGEAQPGGDGNLSESNPASAAEPGLNPPLGEAPTVPADGSTSGAGAESPSGSSGGGK